MTLLVREMTPSLVAGLVAGLLAIYNLSYLLRRQGVLFEVNQFDPGFVLGGNARPLCPRTRCGAGFRAAGGTRRADGGAQG